tara:strand:+ start:36783 stop:38912 length:2130 start_codon:yes stop_codon:yes gene_type:complete
MKFYHIAVLVLISSCLSCAQENRDQKKSAYLFTYFSGNGAGEEAVRYALSRDGFNYYALNNDQPIIDSKEISTTGGVRDPHILRGEDSKTFYMVLTDLLTKNGWTNTEMILLKSSDMIKWESAIINIPQTYQSFSDVNRVWAPQTIYDEKEGKYMVYFSMLQPGSYDKIYYAYVNKDFTALEESPKQLFYSPNEMACIDGDIIKKDNKFYLFYKTEGSDDKGIKVAVSDHLTSGYIPTGGNVDQTNKAVEGSGVFKMIDGDDYILMYDMYMDGRYEFTKSSDLINFKALGADKVSMNFHPRHGTVIAITEEEAERLLKAFPSKNLPLILSSKSADVKRNNIKTNGEKAEIYLPVKSNVHLENFNPELEVFPGAKLEAKGPKNFKNQNQKYTVVLPNGENKTYTVVAEFANNPVLDGFYADPEIIYSNQTKKFYLYPTSDGFDGWSGTYFKTFSSDDLLNWKDEGVILDLEKDVSWTSRHAWAPCIAEKEENGKYKYFYYFTAAQKIGVAISHSPTGPFKDIGKPLIDTKHQAIQRGGGQLIDPDVFTDPVSGISYLYWGNGFMAVAELNNDMISIKEKTVKELTPDNTYREGTEVFYRNGIYYFLWSEDDTRSPNYKVRYATAKTPLGPLNIPKDNIVIQKNEALEIYGTGHNSVINVPGTDEWHIVYHRFNRPKGITMGDAAGFHREVAIDKLNFNDDGTIIEVKPTL